MESESSSGKPCPICLKTINTKETASPECCKHEFCLTCLKRWSDVMNTCPVDRKIYNYINIKSDGEIVDFMEVKNLANDPTLEIEDVRNLIFGTNCLICGDSERAHEIIRCADCYQRFHFDCLNPPLTEMPTADWYCPDCDCVSESDYFEPEEVEMLLEEAADILHPQQ